MIPMRFLPVLLTPALWLPAQAMPQEAAQTRAESREIKLYLRSPQDIHWTHQRTAYAWPGSTVMSSHHV